jgi:hypothetical protein
MLGKVKGLTDTIRREIYKKKNPMKLHCIILPTLLRGRTLQFELVMKVVVSVVNFIRYRGLRYHKLEFFFSEAGVEYGDGFIMPKSDGRLVGWC